VGESGIRHTRTIPTAAKPYKLRLYHDNNSTTTSTCSEGPSISHSPLLLTEESNVCMLDRRRKQMYVFRHHLNLGQLHAVDVCASKHLIGVGGDKRHVLFLDLRKPSRVLHQRLKCMKYGVKHVFCCATSVNPYCVVADDGAMLTCLPLAYDSKANGGKVMFFILFY